MSTYEAMWETNYHDGVRRPSVVTRCPCCSQPVANDRVFVDLDTNQLSYNGHTVQLRPAWAEFLTVLLRSYPGVARYEVCSMGVWGQRDVMRPRTQLSVYAHSINLEIRRIGLEIKSTYEVGYRLVVL